MNIVDENSRLIPGIVRSSTGSIIVTDQKAYIKYISEQKTHTEISELRLRLEKMEQLFKQFVK
jgi:hypothetical protein